ncbi:O-acetylhomoserine/O-acetylserine sulfhydrylase-like pyridoxal-dependent enzyme [Microbacterium testaceum]|uniref:PLP-dependent transferase n=1 Tax=Microbacterium testaceum TaxID=2033 RepID=UPI002785F239|nr:PLP-dependent transferase [Microbacterium testaceum]MDQ1174091.1 O-acetylhomoserine/O-acetylserine sulfhydrylase-like pyridoxal-dependent enzyme [Microbacterium testaceum]
MAPRFGPSPSPLNAFLIGQGIETLSLRVERQSQNALAVARWLEQRPEVERVDYIGLDSHPHHDLGERYLTRGFGSVFTVTLRGGLEAARHVVQSVEVITHMTHLGDVRSLVLHPQSTSHAARTVAERERAGVFPGTIRLSIGIEDIDDLLADLDQALVGVPVLERETVVL